MTRFVLGALALSWALSGIAEGKEERSKAEVIVEIIEQKKRWHEDLKEDPQERRERLLSLASAMVETSDDWTCEGRFDDEDCEKLFPGDSSQLISFMITAGYFETRFNSRIHKGKCGKGECDGGRSQSVFQIKPLKHGGIVPNELWENMQGDSWEQNQSSTQAAALIFSHTWKVCHRRYGVKGIWNVYASGRCGAAYSGSIQRERAYRKNLSLFRSAL